MLETRLLREEITFHFFDPSNLYFMHILVESSYEYFYLLFLFKYSLKYCNFEALIFANWSWKIAHLPYFVYFNSHSKHSTAAHKVRQTCNFSRPICKNKHFTITIFKVVLFGTFRGMNNTSIKLNLNQNYANMSDLTRLCTIGPPARARPTGRRALTGSGLKIKNPARPEPVKFVAGRRSGFLPDGLSQAAEPREFYYIIATKKLFRISWIHTPNWFICRWKVP